MAAIAPMKTIPLWRNNQQLLLLIEQAVRYFPRYHKNTLCTELRQQAMRISSLLPRLREQQAAYCLILEEGYFKVGLKQRLLYALFTAP